MDHIIKHVQAAEITSSHLLKGTGDISSLAVLGLAFMEVLPMAAVVFTTVWMFFRMIETGVKVYRMLFVKSHDRREGDGR